MMNTKEKEESIAEKMKEFQSLVKEDLNKFLNNNPDLSCTFVFCLSHQQKSTIRYATASTLGIGDNVSKSEVLRQGPHYIAPLVDGISKLSISLRELLRQEQNQQKNVEEHS